MDSALDETTAGYLQGQIDENKTSLDLYVNPIPDFESSHKVYFEYNINTREEWEYAISEVNAMPRYIPLWKALEIRFNLNVSWKDIHPLGSPRFELKTPFYGEGNVKYIFAIKDKGDATPIYITNHHCTTYLWCGSDLDFAPNTLTRRYDAIIKLIVDRCDRLFVKCGFGGIHATLGAPLTVYNSNVFVGGFEYEPFNFSIPILSVGSMNILIKQIYRLMNICEGVLNI